MLLLIGGFLVLMLIGVPVAVSMAVASLLYLVFYAVFAGFVLMMLRAIQVFVGNVRRGYSALERPAAFDGLGE